MTNKQILKRLRIEYIAFTLISALLVVLYETHIFVEGGLVGNTRGVYYAELAGIILTLALVPLSLKSYHQALVRMAILNEEDSIRRRKYVRLNEIRLAMIVVVVLVNLSVYYMTVDNTCGYCALIGLVASFFCWPTRDGVNIELTMKEETPAESAPLAEPAAQKKDAAAQEQIPAATVPDASPSGSAAPVSTSAAPAAEPAATTAEAQVPSAPADNL